MGNLKARIEKLKALVQPEQAPTSEILFLRDDGTECDVHGQPLDSNRVAARARLFLPDNGRGPPFVQCVLPLNGRE